MSLRKLLVLVALAAVIGLYIALDLGRYFSLDALKAHQASIEAYRQANPWLASAIYFVIYVAVTALSLPGAAVMTLAAGAIFGLLWGTVLVSFASSIGATLAFLASRFLLRDWVQGRFGERLRAINLGVGREGGFYLFTLRLVPVFPFFMINLLMGLTPMRAATFYWISQLGMLAGTLVYVNAGTQLAGITSLSGIFSPGLIASFALLGFFPLIAKKIVDAIKARKVYARWKRPAKFDRNIVVIGGGSAGLVTAYIAAAVKAKVTLIEKHKLGGDCLNTGCVPSKALIRSAKFLSHVSRAEEFGIRRVTGADFDFADVMERVQRIVRQVEPHDSVERYIGLGVEVIEGGAKIVSPWEVEVTRNNGVVERLSTRSIVIAAGARPFVPPIPGIEEVGYLTSDTVWDLRELPRRLVVLGGGPIGCELAQAFARFGSKVSQVEMLPRLMIREDPEVSELVAARFGKEGIGVLLNHKAKQFVIEKGEKILIAEHEGREVRIPFDDVLVAVGRVANLKGYGLEDIGVAATRTVDTNEFLQTSYPNIYAAGDVAGPYQFTHTAAHQAWYAAVNALFDPFRKFKVDYSVIPWATFVEPEVARVGLNETEAKEQGIAHEVSRYYIDDLDRAIADSEAHGFVKVLTVPGKDRILGVTIVGDHAGDLIAEYVLAMKHGIGLNRILGTIHIYPTLAEANKYVAGVWKKAHAPERLLAWVRRFHAWRRGA
ncbi:MAG: pyridine nucleotide-disulfide oxidoreductase [Betaproteobacteria bacterium]|nr:pyridine nucleotide-disulfide oxidoreductase [Betaproteobacteria bacterium]